jgi:phosphopantetheinyl transferase (holo-ACP synthase)
LLAIITTSTKQQPNKKKERIMTNSEIFKAAHTLAKETLKIVGDYRIAFQFALKEIYMNVKNEVVSIKDKLTSLGLKVWEKSDMERIYINHEQLKAVFGLDISFYKSGSIKKAVLNGEKLSNRQAGLLFKQNVYFDIKLNEFVNAGGLEAII